MVFFFAENKANICIFNKKDIPLHRFFKHYMNKFV